MTTRPSIAIAGPGADEFTIVTVDGHVTILDGQTGAARAGGTAGGAPTASCYLREPRCLLVALGSELQTIEIATGRIQLLPVPPLLAPVVALIQAPDTGDVIAGTADGSLISVSPTTWTVLAAARPQRDPVSSLGWRREAASVTVGYSNGGAYQWAHRSGRRPAKVRSGGRWCGRVLFSQDGSAAIVTTELGTHARYFTTAKPNTSRVLVGSALGISPDGRLVAVGGMADVRTTGYRYGRLQPLRAGSGDVEVCDAGTGQPVASLFDVAASGAIFSTSGETVLTLGPSTIVKVWEIAHVRAP